MTSPLTEVFETRPIDRTTIIEAPNDRVETAFFDRPFPLEDRTARDISQPLPPKFSELPHFMLRELPSALPFRKAKTRAELYTAQECAVNCSKVLHGEHGNFVQEIVRTNLDRVGLRLDDPATNERLRSKLASYSQQLPDFTFRWPRSLNLELHGKSDFVVRAELEQGMFESLENMTQRLVQSLEIINSLGLVPLLDWVYEDAYRTHRYQSEVSRGSSARNGKSTKESEPTSQIVIERHVSEVLCAKNYLLTAAKMPIPDDIRQLSEIAPIYLKPAMRIITGTETRRIVIRRVGGPEAKSELVGEEYLYQPHSALTLGHFVLASWTDKPADAATLESNQPKRLPASKPRLLPAKGENS